MPYMIVDDGKNFCVHKQNSDKSAGEKLKCYTDKKEATKYLQALYANVKESTVPVVEMSMAITKASFDTKSQTMRFRMVASDTSKDVFGERMSLELFNDFTRRIETGAEVPAPFKSILAEKSGWTGGMPYVSIAHYKSGIEGKNIPADTEKVYVDGECLKSTATCRNTPLGKAVFSALKADLEGKSKFEDKVRVSIGFLDLAHSHGDKIFTRDTLDKECVMCKNGVGDKVYLKGQLVHFALTRAPANLNTSAEVDMSKITTKREDAESIVGESLAEEIEINKSTADAEPEILVVKAEPVVEESKKKVVDSPAEDAAEGPEDASPDAEDAAEGEMPMDEMPADHKKKMMKKTEVVELSALDTAFSAFKDEIVKLKSTMTKDEALKALQPGFESLAKAVQDEFADAPAPVQVTATIDPALTELLTKLSTTIDGLVEKVGAISTEVTILKSQTSLTQKTIKSTDAPAPRSVQVERANPTSFIIPDIQAQKPMSIKELALRSVQPQ